MTPSRVCIACLLAACGGQPGASSEPQTLPRVEPVHATTHQPATESCGEYVPNTTVCDNAMTREVLAFCERYRHAMEARDAPGHIALASPRYRDADVDYAQLEATLGTLMQKAQSIRYEIRYRSVTVQPGGTIAVEYNYAAAYQFGTEWKHSVSDSVLVLERSGPSFLILRGM
jgi:hypothetical protein